MPKIRSSTDALEVVEGGEHHRVALLGADPLGLGDHPAHRHPVAVRRAGELGQRAVDSRVQRGPHLLERMGRDEQAERLLLGGQQLGAVELDAEGSARGWVWPVTGRRRIPAAEPEVEDRALADQRVLLGLLPGALGLLEHVSMPLRRGAGGAEGAALDQRLDRLLVHRAAVDPGAEVPQVPERSALLPRPLDRLDGRDSRRP